MAKRTQKSGQPLVRVPADKPVPTTAAPLLDDLHALIGQTRQAIAQTVSPSR